MIMTAAESTRILNQSRVGDRPVPTPAQIADIVRPIARQYAIDELYLFGSMASGKADDDSDIDLIYHTPDDTFRSRRVRNFQQALREAFGRDVDLVRTSYITDSQADDYQERIRSLFIQNIAAHPLYRILPESQER